MRILIVGHNGVLGTRIREQISIKRPDIDQIFLRSNLLNQESVFDEINQIGNIDVLFHLASITATNQVAENVDVARAVNVGGTRNVLEALKNLSKRPKFVFASSSHVYGVGEIPFSEIDDCNPSSIYGKTKLEAELECLSFSKSYQFDIIICRIFSMWDYLQQPPFLFPSLRKRISHHLRNEPFTINGANSVRDFQSATIVAQQMLELSLFGATGIFNIASGNPMTVGEFARKVVAGYDLNVVHVGESNSIKANINKISLFTKHHSVGD